MKKLIFALIFSSFFLAIAGCGSEESTNASSTPDATSDEEAIDTTESTVTEETEPEEDPPTDAELNATYFKQYLKILVGEEFEFPTESFDFVVANFPLFSANTPEDIEAAKKLADSSITSKHLNKNAQPYFGKMATFQGTVISVEEQTLEDGSVVSDTHVLDDNMQSYQVIMHKSTGEVLEDDTVRFWGTPVGQSSFENVSGGTTNVQVFFGSHLEKVQ